MISNDALCFEKELYITDSFVTVTHPDHASFPLHIL